MRTLVSCVLLAIGVTGCGGGGDSTITDDSVQYGTMLIINRSACTYDCVLVKNSATGESIELDCTPNNAILPGEVEQRDYPVGCWDFIFASQISECHANFYGICILPDRTHELTTLPTTEDT